MKVIKCLKVKALREKVKVIFEQPGESWSSVAYVKNDIVGFEVKIDPSTLRFILEVEATILGRYVFQAFKSAINDCCKRFVGLRKENLSSIRPSYMRAEWYIDEGKIGKALNNIGEKISKDWQDKISIFLKDHWENEMKNAEKHLKSGKYEGSLWAKQTIERGQKILKQIH